MYINQCLINVELPDLWYIVVLLPQKRFFSDLGVLKMYRHNFLDNFNNDLGL